MREKFKRSICKRCSKPVDRLSKWDRPLMYCRSCVTLNRKDHNKRMYRKKHPEKTMKYEVIIKLLSVKPRTSSELIRRSNIRDLRSLKATICHLRTRGYIIRNKHFLPSHYVLVNKK